MAQGINDRSTAVAERETKKKETRSGSIGALAGIQRQAPQPSQVGSDVGGDATSPDATTGSIGDIMSPSAFGTEPPPSTAEEMDQRVARNTTFLSNPQTRAQLLQFSLSMLGSAGRGNIGSNLANAITSAQQLPARTASMNLKFNKEVQGMDIAERSQQVEEKRLKLDELKYLREGGMKFSRVISGDDPLNERFGLGLQPGQQARVEFLTDVNNKIVNASVEAPFGEQGGDQSIPTLLQKAQDARKAGRVQEANLLEAQAQTKAFGTGGLTAKGQMVVPDATSPTGTKAVNIPGGESDIAEKTLEQQQQSQREEEHLQAGIALDNIDRAIEKLQGSAAPNAFLTGFGSLLQYLPGTEAADFAQNIATIKAHNTVRALTELRKGGHGGASGLGQVTEFEDKMLSSMMGSLEQQQTAAQMLYNLQQVRKVYDAIVNTGSIADIGKAVDNGSMTQEDGLRAAAGILAPGGNATESGVSKGEEPIPFPDKQHLINMDEGIRARLQNAWVHMPNSVRRSYIVGE